jgi:hypothetical protein
MDLKQQIRDLQVNIIAIKKAITSSADPIEQEIAEQELRNAEARLAELKEKDDFNNADSVGRSFYH